MDVCTCEMDSEISRDAQDEVNDMEDEVVEETPENH